MKSLCVIIACKYIQNFAKSLLDVADNLGRASSVVKDSFAKIDASKDTDGAAPLLKTLLEGVEMTEKQLIEVDLCPRPFFFVYLILYRADEIIENLL